MKTSDIIKKINEKIIFCDSMGNVGCYAEIQVILEELKDDILKLKD